MQTKKWQGLIEESHKPILELRAQLRPIEKKHDLRLKVENNVKLLDKFDDDDKNLRLISRNRLWNPQLKHYELVDELVNPSCNDPHHLSQQDMIYKISNKDPLAFYFYYALIELMHKFPMEDYNELENAMFSTYIPLQLFQRRMSEADYLGYLHSKKTILEYKGKNYYLRDLVEIDKNEIKEPGQEKGLFAKLIGV